MNFVFRKHAFYIPIKCMYTTENVCKQHKNMITTNISKGTKDHCGKINIQVHVSNINNPNLDLTVLKKVKHLEY